MSVANDTPIDSGGSSEVCFTTMVSWGLGWGEGGESQTFLSYIWGEVEYVFPTGLGGGGRQNFCLPHENVTAPPTPHLVINDSSLIGTYKVLSRVLPNCSAHTSPLESATAGYPFQDKIVWTDDLYQNCHRRVLWWNRLGKNVHFCVETGARQCYLVYELCHWLLLSYLVGASYWEVWHCPP